MEINKIYQGDTLEILKQMPDESVDCIITSPPYWRLRDYGVELNPKYVEVINKRLSYVADKLKV